MKLKILTLISFCFILIVNSGCAPSLQHIRRNFYSYDLLPSELKNIQSDYKGLVDLEIIGNTYEGKDIFCLKVGHPVAKNKPALMAIFAEHSGEHETTSFAMKFIIFLVNNYGKDHKITTIFNEKDIYIVPMMNPDGIEYDLSGKVKPFSWRKNRRPITQDAYGVDLNRNWGYMWDAPVPKRLKKQLNNPKDLYYHGDSPFSELESQAIRDFLSTHKNIKIFVDYHSGYASFLQGGIGFPFAYTEEEKLSPQHRHRFQEIAQNIAELITNLKDSRQGFIVSQARDVKKNIKMHSPIYLKPFISLFLPKSTIAPGASADWVYGELGIMSFAIEIMRDGKFLKRLPESMDELVENQMRGFIYLLEELSMNSFENL
jgi:murein tripeptide amidase MpaA